MSEYASESQLYIYYIEMFTRCLKLDKIINEYLDKENLEKAENRLATTRSMNDIEWEEILREHPELRL